MDLFTDFVRALENPLPLYLTELFLKGFLILALFGLLACALRPASAAIRHLLWLGGLGSLLVLPFTVGFLPSVPVPVFTPETVPAVLPVEEARVSSAGPVASEPVAEGEATVVSVSAGEAAPPERASAGSVLPVAVLAIWIVGGLLAILPLACAEFRLRRCVRRAQELASPEWRTLLEDCCETLGLRRSVRLLEGPAGLMPMTWGIRRPVILVPGEADSWPLERRRSVLLHELAHIKRNDCLSQLLARAACAVHWFNPLAWLAYRRVLATRERACDDLVLLADGMKPSDYAKHLLSIAREFRTGFPLGQGAIPMARNSALEGRVRAVLGDGNRRRGAGRKFLLATVLGSVAAAMVAGVIGPNAAAKQGNDPEREPRHAEAPEDAQPEKPNLWPARYQAALNAAQPVRRIERNRTTVNDLGEEVPDPLVIYETQMDEGFVRRGEYGVANSQYGMRVGSDLLMWSMKVFAPPRERTGYAYMRGFDNEPQWEFAPCAQNGLAWITRDDLPTEFYGMNDPRGPEVFGESWNDSTDSTVIVAEGDILFARLVSDPSTVYAIQFAEQGSSPNMGLREESKRYKSRAGTMRIQYIVFPPEGTDVSIESEPKSPGESARSPASESGPAVEVTARFMDVPDPGAVFGWLMGAGIEFKIAETETELTPHSGRLPEGASNAFVRQLTWTIISEDIEGDLHLMQRREELVGSDLLSPPKVTVLSGRGASIKVSQTDPEGIDLGVVTDITPIYDADREIVRLTLTATVTGSTDVAPGADPEYHVRQVKLDDYEVPPGQTVVMGGLGDRDLSRGEKVPFVFVTPEVVEPSPDEADSDL